MSRDLEDENYYVSHGGKIPVKWTAPEVNINTTYSLIEFLFQLFRHCNTNVILLLVMCGALQH